MSDRDQKLAIVTGASRGLGAALAERLGARGYHVVAVGRTTGALEELDDRIRAVGGAATLAPMDITQPAAMIQLVQAVLDRWGGCDLWAHAAIHAAPLGPAPHVDPKDMDRSVSTNITATHGLSVLIEPLLRARNGTALFFDDPRGGEPFFGAYGATKAAQIAFARSWQAENQRIGPRVVIATPKPMPTAIRGRFFPGEDRSALTPCRAEADRILSELAI
ncbi:SDR family oxidoreductase [Paracoccus sp. (in: a-proteobacteria)]|uniref:SDR family NAD(P)-dependent oxidoreductase n=1 Tax=Paracoccus sp. TaxID=267 RepID=UPI0026E0C0BB|nr:SDR family NAD(P)-dependent oxidoreductase [Paracoccus sp. (in: a-proteobacteria)]MDO5369765.1 SDR family NAD(P)-dependent oxidoreductase [Paracoccus sp. (in: a-proteobacteria)]